MKKFTKIMLIIVAVLVVLGLLFCGVAAGLGAGRTEVIQEIEKEGELACGNWHIGKYGIYYGESDASYVDDDDDDMDDDDMDDDDDDMDDDDDDMDDDDMSGFESLATIGSGEAALSEVKNIKMNIDAAEVKIVTAEDNDKITVELKKGKEKYLTCKMEDATFSINYNEKKKAGIGYKGAKILVHVPKQAVFSDVTMKVGAADVKMNVADLTCENLTLDVGAGNFEADGFTVNQTLNASIGAGNLEMDGGIYQNVEMNCGVGNLEFAGTVNGNLTGECGMGNVTLDLKGTETDYDYKLACGMGQIVINGTTYSAISGNKTITNENIIGTIDLDCGMGQITCDIQ